MPVPPTADRRYDQLRVLTFATSADAGRAAAEHAAAVIRAAVRDHGHARAIFATGNSQLALAAALRDQPDVPWGQVTAFHMDEYVGLPADHTASFRRWITTRLVQPLGIGEVHLVDGEAADPAAECRRYEGLLRAAPLDLVCMGIGENGHIAFNEPGQARFDDPDWAKVITLDEKSRRQQVGEGHFPTVADVPAHAISLTVPALLAPAVLEVVVPEARKATAVHAALTGPVTTDCPASILRGQAGATVYLDADSAALL